MDKKYLIIDKTQTSFEGKSDHLYDVIGKTEEHKPIYMMKTSTSLLNLNHEIEFFNRIKWDFIPTIKGTGVFFQNKPINIDLEASMTSSCDSSVLSFGVGKTII